MAKIFWFWNVGYKLWPNSWYKQKIDKNTKERRRTVKTAAKIVLEENGFKVSVTKHYPPLDIEFLKTRFPGWCDIEEQTCVS